MSQSAIVSVEDQLYLATAEGHRLDAVTARLGLPRPHGGYEDSTWRAMASVIMGQPRLHRDVFRRVIEICLGPRRSRVAALATPALIGDEALVLTDSTELVRKGTIVLDPGFGIAEAVAFDWVDFGSHEVRLRRPLRFPHRAIAGGQARLASAITAGSLTVPLVTSALMPTSDSWPFSLLLSRGKPSEEVVVVQSVNTTTHVLTLAAATTKDHAGPTSLFFRTPLEVDTPANRDFLIVHSTQVKHLGPYGFLRIDGGGGNEEVVEFDTAEAGTGSVGLTGLLQNAHVAGEAVELVAPGDECHVASVMQAGTGWDMWEPGPNRVVVYVPPDLSRLRLRDASYLHDRTPAAWSATLAAPGNIGDMTLSLTAVDGLPDGAGIVQVNGLGYVGYIDIDRATKTLTLNEPLVANYAGGVIVVLVTEPYATAPDLQEGNLRDASGTVQQHQFSGPYIYSPGDKAPHEYGSLLATVVAFPTSIIAPTPRGRSNIMVRDAGQYAAGMNVRVGRLSGFEEDRLLVDSTRHVLVTNDIPAGASIDDIEIFLTSSAAFPEGASPCGYFVRLSAGLAAEEDVEVKDNTIGTGRLRLMTPLVNNHAAAASVDLLHDTLTLSTVAGRNHNAGQAVEHLVDELNVTDGTHFPLTGADAWLNFGWELAPANRRVGSFPMATSIRLYTPSEREGTLTAGVGIGVDVLPLSRVAGLAPQGTPVYPSGLQLVLDRFQGNQETVTVLSIDYDALTVKLTAGVTQAHFVGETVSPRIADYPQSGYPYTVWLGKGVYREPVSVTDYDADRDVLSLAVAPSFTHRIGEAVEFLAGTPQVVTYAERVGTTLYLAEPIVLDSGHHASEAVIYAPYDSEPDPQGKDDAFYLPPDPGSCFRDLLDRVKAIGVTVEVVTSP